jgi:hypothetical protein
MAMSHPTFTHGEMTVSYKMHRHRAHGAAAFVPGTDGIEVVEIQPGTLSLDNVPIRYQPVVEALHSYLFGTTSDLKGPP